MNLVNYIIRLTLNKAGKTLGNLIKDKPIFLWLQFYDELCDTQVNGSEATYIPQFHNCWN